MDMQSLLSAFFGEYEGKALQRQVIEPDSWGTRKPLACPQIPWSTDSKALILLAGGDI